MTQPRKSRASVRDAYKTSHSANTGDRIPHSDKVDRDDPARASILITLRRWELAGITIDDRAVEIATQECRWRMEQAMLEEPVAEGDVPRWRRRGREADIGRQSWVYYVRCGHLVKIGTTIDLASRFSAIRPNEVLALEPGGLILESERHREFARLRASGEYFHPGPALQGFIHALREDNGPPNIRASVVPDGQDWFPADTPAPAET
ncbi:GIY-YIG nuclease family protein [Streptomyces pseudogriseolus]|uniref:GIY-YIG nuclease family protein n=1 Tax=Streptomyces pseudogriseolus TaxID=36817 RepID=UPI003FA1DF4B